MGYWNEKVAVVVGGSAGFGKALARELLNAGAKVSIVGRDSERLRQASEELDCVGRITTKSADVQEPQSAIDCIKAIATQQGAIDAVFNCVGKSTRENVLDVDAAKLNVMLQFNLNTIVNVAIAAIPELIKTKGHLVHIGSLASKTAWPFVTSYAVSKSAMATYTHQLRLEGPPEVNYLLVCPGPIARSDTGTRYDEEAGSLPQHAKAAGAGAKIKGILPEKLAQKILKAAANRKSELIVPGYARLAFVAAAISPVLGDWILRRKMDK